MSYPRVSESNLGGTRLSRYPNTIPQRLFGANSIIVRFGDVENAVYHPPTYFDNTYLEEWITDSRTREMVRDVDKSEEIVAGGMLDALNGTLMKMFNLIGVGEKAGSGFDVMRAFTRSAGRPDPSITERHEPDVVTLVLPLETGGLRYAQGMASASRDFGSRSQYQAERRAADRNPWPCA
jgi:hypothetical protein